MRKSKRLVGIILVLLVSVSSAGIWIFLIDATPTVRTLQRSIDLFLKRFVLSAYQDVRLVITNRGREPHTFHGSFFHDRLVRIVWNSADQPPQRKKCIDLFLGQSVSFLARVPAAIYPFRYSSPSGDGRRGGGSQSKVNPKEKNQAGFN